MVTITHDDGSYVKIDMKTLTSTEYDSDGIPAAPVKIVELARLAVPQEVWNVPIPYSDSEIATMIDDVTIQIEDTKMGWITDIDLVTLDVITTDPTTNTVIN